MLATIHPGTNYGSPIEYIQTIPKIHQAIIPEPRMTCIKGMTMILLFSLKNYPATPTISLPNLIFDQLQQMNITQKNVMTEAITPPAIDVFHSVEFTGYFQTYTKQKAEITLPIPNMRNRET